MPQHQSIIIDQPTLHPPRLKVPTTISITPTIAVGAYTAKDAVGGLLTFADAADVSYGSGTIKAMIIVDEAKQSDITLLHLFNQTFTASGDADIFSPSDADLLNYVGYIEMVVADYEDLDDNSIGMVRNIDLPFNLVSAGTSLFGQLMTQGTPTYGDAGAITVKLVIEQD